VVASYSGLYEECEVEHINVPPNPAHMIEQSLYPTQKIYNIDMPQAALMSYV